MIGSRYVSCVCSLLQVFVVADFLSKMQIRHSNMLAQAHFLHTMAEPKLVSPILEFSSMCIC